MRTPDSPINTMMIFWYLVYALALFSVFVARLLARNEAARMSLSKQSIKQSIRDFSGSKPRINPKQLEL